LQSSDLRKPVTKPTEPSRFRSVSSEIGSKSRRCDGAFSRRNAIRQGESEARSTRNGRSQPSVLTSKLGKMVCKPSHSFWRGRSAIGLPCSKRINVVGLIWHRQASSRIVRLRDSRNSRILGPTVRAASSTSSTPGHRMEGMFHLGTNLFHPSAKMVRRRDTCSRIGSGNITAL